jgi:hypothetical protein
MSNDRMIVMNWKGCGRKQMWPNLRYYPEFAWRDQFTMYKKITN